MQPEQIAQKMIYEYISKYTDLPFHHSPNEIKCPIQYRMIRKSLGVLAGFSDIFIPRATNLFYGTFIEIKIKPNKATEAQLNFVNNMIREGYYAKIISEKTAGDLFDATILDIKTIYGLK